MQCFSLYGKTTSGLNKIARQFFWNTTNNHRGFSTISWDKICWLRKLGGLGLRKIEAINNAFQCKLAWKILTSQNSYWVRSIESKYLHKGCFLTCSRKPSDPPVGRVLFVVRTYFQQVSFGRLVMALRFPSGLTTG